MKTRINYSPFVLLMVLISVSVLYAQYRPVCQVPTVNVDPHWDRSCISLPTSLCPQSINRNIDIIWNMGLYADSHTSQLVVGKWETYDELAGGCSKIPKWKECEPYADPAERFLGGYAVPGNDAAAIQGFPLDCQAGIGVYGAPVVKYIPWVRCDRGTDKTKRDRRECAQCNEDYDCPYDPGTPYWCNNGVCQPVGGSPIIVSEHGNQLQLTDQAGGVHFDLNIDGTAELISWTTPGSDDAFLAMDRNGNGAIDNGGELFGNYTPQPPAPEKNGFLALAMLDRPDFGGNGDGLISEADQAYDMLVMWTDANHDGISQPGEMKKLSDFGITAIGLDYRVSRRVDEYGNRFRYISRVDMVRGQRHAVDVFLLTVP